MNALKEAQHQAGMQTALKVFVFFTVIAALFLSAAIFCASTGFTTQYASLLLDVFTGTQLLVILGALVAYFIERKNPNLIRKQLEIVKAQEEADVCHFEKILAKLRESTAQREVTTEQAVQVVRTRTVVAILEQREAILNPYKFYVDKLRKREQQASQRDRIRNQDLYLQMDRTIREAETTFLFLENKPVDILQEILATITKEVNSNMESYWAEVEKEIKVYEKLLVQAKHNITSIGQLLEPQLHQVNH